MPNPHINNSILLFFMYSSQHYVKPDKEALLKQYQGKTIDELPTPSFLIDRKKFAENSKRMLAASGAIDAEFRCHVKTHKTVEGVTLQLGDKTDLIVVSTLAEAWTLLPLIQEGKIKEVLYGLPPSKLRVAELADLALHVNLKLLVDHVSQILELTKYSQEHGHQWTVYVKVDMGYGRAGVRHSKDVDALLEALLSPVNSKSITVYGFYCHAGNSYGAKTQGDAKQFLVDEVKHVNDAALTALRINPDLKLHLSVGATPTAHISEQISSISELEDLIGEKLAGTLELHAGNYPCCDLQQVATGLVSLDQVSVSLLAEVISEYPGRGDKAPGEQLINAGAIALARETGPLPGYGKVISGYGDWIVGKVSQEHGVLVPGGDNCKLIPYGTKIKIIPQHACMTAASHGWYFIFEDGKVVDVWVPAKTW